MADLSRERIAELRFEILGTVGDDRAESVPISYSAATLLALLSMAERAVSAPIDELGYDAGVEVCPKVDGWIVITGKDGEDFCPVAFFFDRERAEQYCELTYDDGAGNNEPVAFDSCAIEAVVMHDRIVCSNDYALDSHAKLRAHVAARLAAKGGEDG